MHIVYGVATVLLTTLVGLYWGVVFSFTRSVLAVSVSHAVLGVAAFYWSGSSAECAAWTTARLCAKFGHDPQRPPRLQLRPRRERRHDPRVRANLLRQGDRAARGGDRPR